MAKATANKSAAVPARLAAPENFVGPGLVGDAFVAIVVGFEPPIPPIPTAPCELVLPPPLSPPAVGLELPKPPADPPPKPPIPAVAVGWLATLLPPEPPAPPPAVGVI